MKLLLMILECFDCSEGHFINSIGIANSPHVPLLTSGLNSIELKDFPIEAVFDGIIKTRNLV